MRIRHAVVVLAVGLLLGGVSVDAAPPRGGEPAVAWLTAKHLRFGRPFRFFYESAGFRRMSLQATDMTVVGAHVHGDQWNRCCFLFLDRVVDSTPEGFLRSQVRFFGPKGAVAGAPEACELAGRPALRVRVRGEDGTELVAVAEKGTRERGFFGMAARAGGEHAEANLPRLERAIASFTTDCAGPLPDGFREDPIAGFRIRLMGFAGHVSVGLPFVMAEMATLRDGTRSVGSLVAHVCPGVEKREAELARFRKSREKEGRRVLAVEEIERHGLPAAIVTEEFEESGEVRRARWLLIFDRDVLWRVVATCAGEDESGPARPLLRALESFRVETPDR